MRRDNDPNRNFVWWSAGRRFDAIELQIYVQCHLISRLSVPILMLKSFGRSDTFRGGLHVLGKAVNMDPVWGTLLLGGSGGGAGLGWGGALGARAEGWLSKAVVQKRAGKKTGCKNRHPPFISGRETGSNSSSGCRCRCSPGHAERCAVFIFVSFADFLCNTKTQEGTRVKLVCFHKADAFVLLSDPGANGPATVFSFTRPQCFEIKRNCARYLL